MQWSKWAELKKDLERVDLLPIVFETLSYHIINTLNTTRTHLSILPVVDIVGPSSLDTPTTHISYLYKSGQLVNTINLKQTVFSNNKLLYRTGSF